MIFDIMVIVFGCLIGSFLTVCIYRIPFASLADEDTLDGEAQDNSNSAPQSISEIPEQSTLKAPFENLNISSPKRSFCPSCLKQLSWWHNIPVLSWIILRGKCWYCKHPIPVRYPLIEISTALLAFACWKLYGPTPTALLLFAFCAALIVIMVIDYDHYIIPNVISLPGTVIGLVVALSNQFFNIFSYPVVPGIKEALFGVLSGAGFLFLVSEFYLRVRKIEGLGMGDVKLLAMTGAFFGMECSLYTIFIGSILGALIGLTLILIQGRKMSQPLPFGPYLACATLIYLFGGPTILADTAELVSKIFMWH